MAKDRFKIIPASYLILIENGKILLSRRFNTGFQDRKYTMISGHLEGNENFRQCMKREAKEESNLDLNEDDMEIIHVMNRREMYNPIELRERVDVFIKAGRWQGEIRNMEPERCDDLSWFPLDNLPENTIPYIRHAIECIRKNIFYSEFGWDSIYFNMENIETLTRRTR